MEVLGQMLNTEFITGSIKYHHKASDPAIIHLAFADDVMVFFYGEQGSLQLITATLNRLSSWSGLVMNKSKTKLFTAWDEPCRSYRPGKSWLLTRLASCQVLGSPSDAPEALCLGIQTSYRSAQEHVHLVVLSGSPLCWIHAITLFRHLQYRKILVLKFILPKGCIWAIESLCAKFLWNGKITSRAAAKVSWTTICLPKSKGGLGLRDFSTWNKSLCLKLILLLHCESESLWAKWTKKHILKGASIWSFDETKQESWIWKAILKLRSLAERFLKCDVGNDLLASFWFDRCNCLGPVIKLFGYDGPRQTCIPLNTKLRYCCTETWWLLQPACYAAAETLHIVLCSIQLPSLSSQQDCYRWEVDGFSLTSFSAIHTWKAIRNRSHPANLSSVIWFAGPILSFAFHMWVAHLDRLPTRLCIAEWSPSYQHIMSPLQSTWWKQRPFISEMSLQRTGLDAGN